MSGPPRSSVIVSRLSCARPGQPTTQVEILGELRRVILAGDAPPGTPIPLDLVAQFFVVSPIPMRESLKTLIGEGLVDHEPRGGYRVAELTQDELREFYVIREVLEAAALRSAVARAAPADDDHAAAIHEGLGEALADQDYRRTTATAGGSTSRCSRPRGCTGCCTCSSWPGTSRSPRSRCRR